MAGFIGSANLLPAVGQRGIDRRRPRRSTWPWAPRSTSPTVGDAPPGGDVTVMLRPERMAPHEGEPLPGRSVVGEIKDVIYQGSEIRLIVDLDDDTEIIVADRARPRHRADARPGNLITLTWTVRGPVRAARAARRSSVPRAPTSTRSRPRWRARSTPTTTCDGDGRPGTAAVARRRSRRQLDRPAQVPHRRWHRRRRRARRGRSSPASAAAAAAARRHATAPAGRRAPGSATAPTRSTSSTGPSTSTSPRTARSARIDRFQDETGVSVNYSETWNDNNEAYGKEFVAYLEAGNPTPWDIAVPTYWLVRPAQVERLAGADPVQPHPELREPRAAVPQRRLGPGREVQPALAGRRHRVRLQHRRDRPRADERQRAVQPRVRRSRSASSPRCGTRSGW